MVTQNCSYNAVHWQTNVFIVQGSYGHEKPGKISNFQAWRSFGKINKPRKFWKSHGNLLHKYLYNRVYVVQLRSTAKNLYWLNNA